MKDAEGSSLPVTPEMIATGNALLADATAVEVVAALRGRELPSILLRGPVVARHFYGDSEVRGYADADVLVAARHRAAAETALQGLGFEHSAVLGQRAADRPPWSSTWIRPRDGATVDLHWSLVGARADAADSWAALQDETEAIEVLGAQIDGLNERAAALIVALHVAHHGPAFRRPLDDLERALAALSPAMWEEVRGLAARLDATVAFGAGLRLTLTGARVADELQLPVSYDVETRLRVESAPPTSLGFEWLSRTPGVRRKLLFVAGKLVPDREFMRAWSPLARTGSTLGLALAYAWRPFWLALHGAAGFKAWQAARRHAASDRPRDER